MKFIRILGALLFLGSWVGCGSSDSKDEAAREFSQNIDRVAYNLSDMEVKISVGKAASKKTENLQKSIDETGAAKDSITRLINEKSFVLVINDKPSSLQISSAGNIDHHQGIQEKNPGCELSGTSKVDGKASSLEFNLDWNFEADLKGDSCDSAMLEKYLKFQDSEMEVFNLNSVKNLLQSADLTRNEQRHIRLNVKISGDAY